MGRLLPFCRTVPATQPSPGLADSDSFYGPLPSRAAQTCTTSFRGSWGGCDPDLSRHVFFIEASKLRFPHPTVFFPWIQGLRIWRVAIETAPFTFVSRTAAPESVLQLSSQSPPIVLNRLLDLSLHLSFDFLDWCTGCRTFRRNVLTPMPFPFIFFIYCFPFLEVDEAVDSLLLPLFYRLPHFLTLSSPIFVFFSLSLHHSVILHYSPLGVEVYSVSRFGFSSFGSLPPSVSSPACLPLPLPCHFLGLFSFSEVPPCRTFTDQYCAATPCS